MTTCFQSTGFRSTVRRAVFFFVGVLCCMAAHAAALEARIHQSNGSPVANAVITLEPDDGAAPPAVYRGEAIMDQRHSRFVPHVLVVPVGTLVHFPNSDNVHHDVYSFSPAKTFDLPLYKGVHAQPVLFDKPGVVVLGCNIHDWMLGYIDVVTTPWYAKTDANGRASLTGIPPGKYRVTIWQPGLDAPGQHVQQDVELAEAQPYVLDLGVKIVPPLHPHDRQ
ncbi:MAG: methylamine utilization protein [Rhodanobacteraceae bacterium]